MAYLITGGNEFQGNINVQVSKNAVLPMMAGSLLTDEEITLVHAPDILDVRHMEKLLASYGKKVEHGKNLSIKGEVSYLEPNEKLVSSLRASVFLLGASLARFQKAVLPLPGGCAIGKRPIDFHLSAFRSLGVEVLEEGRKVICSVPKKRGGKVFLPFPSVGATENLMLYLATAEGESVIYGGAQEAEIFNLASFLNRMGAKIKVGREIVIDGVKKLTSVRFQPMPDRIECGTFLIACAIAGGEITLEEAFLEKNDLLWMKLRQNGCKLWAKDDKITIRGGEKRSFSIQTGPYPAFATDLQPLMGALASVSNGTSTIEENVFEKRYAYLKELRKMGANVSVRGKVASITGAKLHGENVTAKDLRGGAALVLASLIAEGTTVVSGDEYIDRGYADFEKKLSLLGARIERITHE